MGNSREIRPVGPDYLEEYLEIYLNAYPAYKSLDEDCRQYYREKTLLDMTTDQEVDFVGMFEGDKLIALMKLVRFQINLYGQMHPTVGLMSLAVHPLFKKQGAALEMVKYYEQYALDHGASVAILLPFNMEFYRRMGYGLGARMDEYHIRTSQLPECSDLSHLRLLHMEDIDDVLACHEAFARANHGMLIKFEEEIREMRKDFSTLRVGYYEDEKLVGYAAYRLMEASETNYTLNEIVVDELIYRDSTVLRALLGFLRNQSDLAQTIVLRSGEEDFYHLFDDAAHLSGNYIPFGYLQTNTSAMGNMYKLLDPAKFVADANHRCFPALDRTVRFCYEDSFTKENQTLDIEFRNGCWSASSKGTATPDATVTCRQSDLSSLLMNCGRLSSFLRLGVMEIDHPECTGDLDYLLYYNQKPFSNSDF